MSSTTLRSADRVGFTASFLCAVHCALVPLLLAALPAVGLNLAGWEGIDEAFVVFASILGVTTLAMGWRRHRVVHAWYVLVFGLTLLWVGAFTHIHHHVVVHAVFMTIGGLSVAAAHFLNMRLTHAHTHACGCTPAKPDVHASDAVVRVDAC